MNKPDLIIENNALNCEDLNQRISQNLKNRTNSNEHYSLEETISVSKIDRTLFPKDFEVSDESRELIRILASFSACELKAARHFTSHRKLLGPIIVFLKKITWPIIMFHLKDKFETQQQLFSWMIFSQAKQIREIELLKRKLSQY